MTTPPPGWYDDGHGARRWWDGANWTDFVEAQAAEQPAAFPAPGAPVQSGSPAPAEIAPPFTPGPIPPAGIAPTYVPDGYATAVYPGALESAAPPAAPTPRPWIVWVVIGAVVVAVVIALAVLSPVLWSSFSASNSPSGVASPAATQPASATPEASGSPEEPPLSTADEQAAVAAVQRHNEAWLVGDCEGFMATTTQSLREFMEITDCESFAVESRNLAGGVDDYVTTIRDVEALGSAVAVSTSETYTSRFDAEGNQTDEALEYEERYEYIVVRSDSGWAIESFFLE